MLILVYFLVLNENLNISTTLGHSPLQAIVVSIDGIHLFLLVRGRSEGDFVRDGEQ
jgi:hypothetical protein